MHPSKQTSRRAVAIALVVLALAILTTAVFAYRGWYARARLAAAFAARDSVEARRWLMAGAPLTTRTDQGYNVVMWAAEHGDERLLRSALTDGVDVNAIDTRFDTVALECAILTENRTCALVLLDAGASPNRKNRRGETLLHVVADKRLSFGDEPQRTAWVRLLCAHGADPQILDDRGLSPAALAKRDGFTRTAEELEAQTAAARSKS